MSKAKHSISPQISRRDFLKGTAAAGVALTQPWSYVFPANAQAATGDTPVTYRYTYCDMCNHGPKCGIKATVQDNRVIKIESRTAYPNDPLCAKGIASIQELYDPHRLLYPMKRTAPKGAAEPGWQKISWEEALQTIADNLNRIKANHGAEKVLFMTGDPKEPRSALQRLAYTFGSPNFGTESSTCFKGTEVSCKLMYGHGTLGSNPTDKTKVCLVWSKNAAWSGPYAHHGLLAAKEKGVKFIVVDPRVTPTVSCLADIHLQLRPGTDGALALGLAHVMIRDGLYDQEFVEKWTVGFEEYAAYVKEFTPQKVEEITRIPAQLIEEAAKLWATDRPGTWIGSAAPTVHSSNAGNNHRAIVALIALAGDYDVDGGVTLASEPINFDEFHGTEGFSRAADLLPKLRDKRADKNYFPVWAHLENQVQLNRIPEYVENGALKGLVMVGGNAMMWPQTQQYQKAIEKMDFSVAADYYIRPWTHNFMDMVLPAAMCYERMAPLAVFGRKIYLREPVVQPAGEARPDWRIIFEIGNALGYKEEFWGGGEKCEEEGIKEVLRTLNVPVTIEELRANPEGFSVPMKGKPQFKKYELGLIRKDKQPGFNTPSGKLEFTSAIAKQYGFDALPVYKEPLESPLSTPDLAKTYPLILNTGSRLPYYTHSKLRNLPWLNQFMPEPVVRLHPRDAGERGIKEGDPVEIKTPHGSVKMKAALTHILMPGVIDVFHGWSQADINLVIPRNFDPITGFPPFKEGLCQVSKL